MANANVAKTAGNACKYLEMAQYAVAVVGVLLAIGSVVLGFTIDEPWVYGPINATEDWHSIVAGIVGGVVILVQTLISYAILGGLDAVAEDIYYDNAGAVAPAPTDMA